MTSASESPRRSLAKTSVDLASVPSRNTAKIRSRSIDRFEASRSLRLRSLVRVQPSATSQEQSSPRSLQYRQTGRSPVHFPFLFWHRAQALFGIVLAVLAFRSVCTFTRALDLQLACCGVSLEIFNGHPRFLPLRHRQTGRRLEQALFACRGFLLVRHCSLGPVPHERSQTCSVSDWYFVCSEGFWMREEASWLGSLPTVDVSPAVAPEMLILVCS